MALTTAVVLQVVGPAERNEVFRRVRTALVYGDDVVEVDPAFVTADSAAGPFGLALVLVSHPDLVRDLGGNGLPLFTYTHT